MSNPKITFYNEEKFRNHGGFEVPSHIGFIVILAVSLAVSWITVTIGEKIIQNMPNAQITSHNQQMQKALDGVK